MATGIWEQRKGETAEQRRAFGLYLAMAHPRSMAVLASTIGKGHRTIQRWAGAWDWVARAAAYDAACDGVPAPIPPPAVPEDVRADMAPRPPTATELVVDRARKIADALSAEVLRRLGHPDAPEGTVDVDLSARDLFKIAASWSDSVVRWESAAMVAAAALRGAQGDPADAEFDLDSMEDSEVEQLLELRRKAAKGAA